MLREAGNSNEGQQRAKTLSHQYQKEQRAEMEAAMEEKTQQKQAEDRYGIEQLLEANACWDI